MTQFWLAAALMTLVALGFLGWPIWRGFRRTGTWSTAGIAAIVLLAPVAIQTYNSTRTWNGEIAEPVATADEIAIIDQLAARMEQTPDDVEGWVLLGRTYLAIERYTAARQAFMQAMSRSPNPDPGLRLNLAVAMMFSDRTTVTGLAGNLVDEVLAEDPQNAEGLYYGGLVAAERGQTDLARDRWSALLAMNPPEDVARALQQQIAMLDVAAGLPNAGSDPTPTAGPTLRLTLDVGPGIDLTALPETAALFIFARAQAGGPPLAVIREPVSALPGAFTLSDANVLLSCRSWPEFHCWVSRVSKAVTSLARSATQWQMRRTGRRRSASSSIPAYPDQPRPGRARMPIRVIPSTFGLCGL